MTDTNLVTTCVFHGQEYLFKMGVLNNNNLEILVTDKSSGEEWQCSYDATYIENVTQKTGNFKQFKVFIAMIKSGILRTSESVTLDLLTFEDLEMLRCRKITKTVGHHNNNNRRYLIVTYVVEFDKIRYPIPMEYCGPPDPFILQGTIKRLEAEVCNLREELVLKSTNTSGDTRKIYLLQKRIEELTNENVAQQAEIDHLNTLLDRKSKLNINTLHKAVSNLEESVVRERNSHHSLVEKLRNDKMRLFKELERVKSSETNLKSKLNRVVSQTSRIRVRDRFEKSPTARHSYPCFTEVLYQREKSKSPSCHEYRNRPPSRTRKKEPESIRPRMTRCNITTASRSSSTSERSKYLDETSEYSDMNKIRSHSASPCRKSGVRQEKNKVFSSDASLRESPRVSTRNSRSKTLRTLDYRELEEKIGNLQKLLKKNMPSSSK